MKIPLNPPEAMKKLVWCCFTSFRRKPESRIPGGNREPIFELVPDFRRDDVWTPVFTGETNTVRFFHTFPFSKGEVFLLPFVKGGGEGFKRAIFYIIQAGRSRISMFPISRGSP
jgi:hypothetical protein